MNAIKRDVARNIREILAMYEDIASYVESEWALGAHAAKLIEDWYWTRGL